MIRKINKDKWLSKPKEQKFNEIVDSVYSMLNEDYWEFSDFEDNKEFSEFEDIIVEENIEILDFEINNEKEHLIAVDIYCFDLNKNKQLCYAWYLYKE